MAQASSLHSALGTWHSAFGSYYGRMSLSLEFLGTGTSVGVPVIGCDCAVCQSSDPHDKRLRSSALLRGTDGSQHTTVLLDTTPDFRTQMLRSNVRRLDALVITHFHADHVCGIDDIRRFNVMQREIIDLWGTAATLEKMRQSFGYVFSDTLRQGWPSIRAREIHCGTPFKIGCLEFLPFELDHQVIINTGLRISSGGGSGLGYCLDVKRFSERAFADLAGTDTLVLDMLREMQHPTHMNLEEAMAVVSRLNPRRVFFGHMGHEVSHAELERRLPEHIRLAYDGLKIEV